MRKENRAENAEEEMKDKRIFQTTALRLCVLARTLLFLYLVFTLVSCPDDIHFGERVLSEGKGSLSLYIDDVSSRTILPQNTDWSSFTGTFEIEITGQLLIIRNINNLSAPIVLNAGNYNVTVTALDGTAPIARGQVSITIIAGTPDAHIIRLNAIIDAGIGTFNWNITVPAVESAQMRITEIDGTPVGNTESLSQGANTGTRNLNSGHYFVTTTLKKAGRADIVRRDVLHIYQNITSEFAIEFTDALFNSNVHNVIFDHGYGGMSDFIPVIHGDKAVRPSLNPVRDGYVFMDWYTDSSLTALYDFDMLVSIGITLYAKWGSVTVTSGGVTVIYDNLTDAINSITAAGDYIVTVYSNQTLGARRLDTAGINITFEGTDMGESTIQYNGPVNDRMFFITNGVSLTLGNNITLVGINGGAMQLLYVQNGTLTMQSGSKITGHSTSMDVIVVEGASSRFIMNGGSITANATTHTGGSSLSGGIFINASATATITGGSITGNSPVDIYIDSTSVFNLSGNAQVGNIRLNASSATANTSITLDAFTGSAASLHLRSDTTVINNVIFFWLNKQVIQAASGHTLTAEDIAKFPPGNFITSSTTVNQQPISNTHIFGNEAPDLGKLITIPRVTVNNGTTITNFDNLTAAFTAIGWATGNFTIKLYEDQTMTSSREFGANQHILIIGAGGVRTINGSNIAAASHMFTVNGATTSLTLGENITIKGRTTAGAGAVINNSNGTFRMLAGSKITGHVCNSGTSAAVNISGVGSVFEMLGGSIDNNTTTAAAGTTTTSGGVIVTQGTLIMTGGSITGNTQGTEPSDVYHVNTAVNSFTISGNASIGALKLNAGALANAYTKVTIGAGGWTGEITTLNLRGDNAGVTTTVSYWASSTKTIFNDITAAEVAQIGLGEFIGSTNARQAISPTYIIGTESANLGKLAVNLAIAPVTVTLNGETTGYINLTAAFTGISSQQAGDFTVTLKEDQTMTEGRPFNIAGQNITIVSNGGMRTINCSTIGANTTLFGINNATASLTLGENITIQGRTASAGEGAVVQISAGTFTMQGNSRIQGHNINISIGGSGGVFLAGGTFNMRDNSVITGISSSTAGSAAVYIANSNSTFNMQGGQITGNSNSTAITNTSLSGGVFLINGNFIMTGGSITGNTQLGNASDVYHGNATAGSFTISGEAVIGELKLTATSNGTAQGSSVAIGAGGWTGSIETLNLRGNTTVIATALDYWTTGTRAIFNDITAVQVSQIGLGEFVSSANARQAIGPVYRIGTEGANLGRLVLDAAFAPVTVTLNGASTGYLTLHNAFSAIGTQAGNFTITLRSDQTLTTQTSIYTANQNITIVGEGGLRTIIGNTQSIDSIHIFAISNADASLTLGNNVNLQGRTAPAAGAVINNTNGTFRMLPGSRITGHRSNGGTSAAVNIIGADSVFEMSGGSIDGNNTSMGAVITTSSAGVYFTNGTFIMTGGSITGNTQGGTDASDVYFGPTVAANYNTSSLQISGSANIGALKLNANSTTVGATVSIGTGWTGSITTLNLRGDQNAIATAIGFWDNKTIFNGITAAQVARIGLGEFISGNNARQAIAPAYYIGTIAPDLGGLLYNPANAPVTVTVNSETTNYPNLTAAFTAIGNQAGDFTVTLRANLATDGHTISAANQHITITGEGETRTINGSSIITYSPV